MILDIVNALLVSQIFVRKHQEYAFMLLLKHNKLEEVLEILNNLIHESLRRLCVFSKNIENL